MRRRPDFTDETSHTWRLLTLFGFHLDLCVVFYSDDKDDRRPADHSALHLVLKGVCMFNGKWIDEGCFIVERAGKPANVRLFPAQSYGEQLLDMPWMDKPDIKYDTDRRVWLLGVSRA